MYSFSCGRSYIFISIIEIVHLILYQLCMTWLNWSLIIETSLWSKNCSTFDTHPQHTSSIQLMLISFVWLYMFKCDVYVQLLADQTKKYFWVFYMFLKVILYFHVFKFLFKMYFCVFLQKPIQRQFREKLAT